MDAERVGALFRHHQRIGVFESEFAEQRDLLLRQRRFQIGEQFCARLDVGAMKLVGPQRAGIIDVDVDVVARQRVEDHVGAEALARTGRQSRRPQPLRHQRRQHILLGKGFGADDIGRLRARHRRHQRRRHQRQHARPRRSPREPGCEAECRSRPAPAIDRPPAPAPPRQSSRTARTPSSGFAALRKCNCRGWSGRSASTASRCRSPIPRRCGCPPSSPAAPAAIPP